MPTKDFGRVIGPQGPQGERGPAGPQGPKGDTGAAGRDGMSRRAARLVVGTAQAGWTQNDCDYLCDGTADQEELLAAIAALPSGGGEVVLLDGTYCLSATITLSKANVTLSGCGRSTVLFWNGNFHKSLIIAANNCKLCGCYLKGYETVLTLQGASRCVIRDNELYGNGSSYVMLDIETGSDENIVMGNIISGADDGINISGNKNVVMGNVFSSASVMGYTRGAGNVLMGNYSAGDSPIDSGSHNIVENNAIW